MQITRQFAMPNKNTFLIKPIQDLILKYIDKNKIWIDPFCNDSYFKNYCKYTNDLDHKYKTSHHLDANEFLNNFDNNSIDGILFDAPYSPRQVSECYKKFNKSVNMQTTQASFWGKLKKQISNIIKSDGIVISCSWNSGGIGKTFGFKILEILLVHHGGWHNDTICVVEQKIQGYLF